MKGVIARPECRHAAALGLWRLWWPGRGTHDTVLRTAVMSLADIQGNTPGSLEVDRLSEDTIESTSEIVAAAVQSLSMKGYFVEKTIRHVPPGDRACAARSQVKYFHEDDRAGVEQPPPGWPIGAERGLTDLSDWTLSAKVPRGQLELWWIAAGDRCEAGRAAAVEGAAG